MRLIPIFMLSTALLASGAVSADENAALYKLLEALHENGTIDSETYAAIKATAEQGRRVQAEPDTETIPSAAADAQTRKMVKEEIATAERDKPKISTKGKFEIASADEDFKFRVGGRILVDAAIYDNDIADHGNGSEIRRGRLFASGTLWRVWDYKFEYEFMDSGADGIEDAYLAYTGLDPVEIQGGHFKEPFSLQNLTSSKYVNFIERGLPHLFTPGRNIGIALNSGGNHWSASAGLFGSGIGDPNATNDFDDDNEGFGVTGRVTYAPINNGNQVLHLGGALSYRHTDQDKMIAFSDRPESHITDVRLVDTGNSMTIDADNFYRYGMEAAWVYDRLTLQGEYMGVSVDRALMGNPDLDFDGYYAEIMWFLTEDHRPYSGSSGKFNAVSPNSVVGKGGYGAWQVGARISNVDLIDGDINGGEEDNLTLGLNWFPNANLRFSANYIKVLDTEGGPVPGDEPDIFAVRGQLEF